jgi:hypothetical protein
MRSYPATLWHRLRRLWDGLFMLADGGLIRLLRRRDAGQARPRPLRPEGDPQKGSALAADALAAFGLSRYAPARSRAAAGARLPASPRAEQLESREHPGDTLSVLL